MKKLYSFTLNKEIEVEEPQISKNDKGEEIKVLVKVKKQEPHNYFIAKPTRALLESAEMFFASIVSKCISQGILSVSLYQKRVLNDGGILSDEQKKEYESLHGILFEKQAIHKNLLSKLEPTEEDKQETTKVLNEIVDILTKIQNLEIKTGNTLYQNTAENIARNRTSVFWTLFLSYKEEDGKEMPVFLGKNYEEKLSSYDNLEENGNQFDLNLLNKLFLITSLWYLGKAEKQEDFDILLKMADNQGVIDTISTT